MEITSQESSTQMLGKLTLFKIYYVIIYPYIMNLCTPYRYIWARVESNSASRNLSHIRATTVTLFSNID